ncbi:response regulator transcription factor [Rugosimonospora acidiphila]|uniref:Response regulator transcription factor n=1 Tax=Rugosimonospora acidiphila TaxID=556531 RepID=A0ABP9RJI6_9ACTN
MRVVIAEDLFLLRDGLTHLLREHGFDIVAAVEDGPALLHALRTEAPDVAVVDIRLPPSFTDDGLRAALAARQERPGLPILLLSQYVEPLYARELLADEAGAIGYLLKDRVSDAGRFVEAVRQVASGGTVLDPHVVSRLLVRSTARGTVDALTDRERDVLGLMAEGRSNSAISQRLYISESAVTKHTASIFAKLDLPVSNDDNRRVLAVLAYLNR